MTPARQHDYALVAKILRNEPKLEGNVRRLAARYTELHPEGLVITKEGMRHILRNHSGEVLGRPYVASKARGRLHDYGVLRELIAEDPELVHQPTKLARLYHWRTRKTIHPKYIATLLRTRRAELVPPRKPSDPPSS